MDDALAAKLADAGFPLKYDGAGKAKPLSIEEIYAQTGKLFTTLTKDGWLSQTIDGTMISKPCPSWEESGGEIFLAQKGT